MDWFDAGYGPVSPLRDGMLNVLLPAGDSKAGLPSALQFRSGVSRFATDSIGDAATFGARRGRAPAEWYALMMALKAENPLTGFFPNWAPPDTGVASGPA